MSEERLDPRIDTLMAALYGELSESEERAFRRVLETDPALRAEWDELRGSRNVLAGWSVEETVPSFVMLGDPVTSPAARRAATSGWWSRLTESLRGLGGGPAWGLATAAVAVAAFLIADARVDRKVQDQVATLMAQGGPAASQVASPGAGSTAAPAAGSDSFPGSVPMELASHPGTTGSDELVPVTGTYMTREEFEHSNDQLMGSIASVLNEYGQRRDQETLDLLQAMYERMNQQQLYDYRQLNGRIENLGHELQLNRSMAEDKIEQLLGPAEPRDSSATAEDDKE